jgi:hypothetical protein
MIQDAPCQARIRELRADGTDLCSRMGAHSHYSFAANKELLLCTQHRDCLARRERLGSSETLLLRWDAT